MAGQPHLPGYVRQIIIHPKLRALGWNQRILTYGDFTAACKLDDILILNAPLKWAGFFTIYRGHRVIG